MCYYFDETERIRKLFNIAIIIILVGGIIAGIVCGASLKGPTKDAIEAMSNITLYPNAAKINPEWYEVAEETGWTFAGVCTMLAVWMSSAIAALLLYGKKHQIELNDMTAGTLKNIEGYAKTIVEVQQELKICRENVISAETE